MARTLPKSMTGIAHDLFQNRIDASNARKRFVVVSLTKKGTPAKHDRAMLQSCGTETMEQAEVIRARMTLLNPDKTFVIILL